MSKNRDEKKAVIKSHRLNEKDTGSPEVQIALLTDRINKLGGHFKTHVKDFHSRRGLLMLVGHRRRLLKFLKGLSTPRYNKIVTELGLRK